MLQNSKIRKKALESLEGNWGSAAVTMLVYAVITSIVNIGSQYSLAPFGLVWEALSNLSALLLLPMTYAFTVGMLGLVRGKKVAPGMLFDYYTNSSVWALCVLTGIYTILWSLLFLVPGIIKYYSYSMAPYLLKDNPEMTADEAICASMKMTRGCKMKLFLLDLSFIGWVLLSVLTLGLGFLLLSPYMYSAHAVFYEELKAECGIDAPLAGEVA
ncbi:MAG: DUF975 family protein [Bacteroidales bacterium]|nr:DUF975 family protein [Bacteroidales bacterium]MCM1146338.1 DUF975 family protein [Bacteroidales bacterium]MCM1205224.1 DUF975 family protein [Bacillota bacterium]MCM1509691.1 DUF975 family protein [Clostridium sp.]